MRRCGGSGVWSPGCGAGSVAQVPDEPLGDRLLEGRDRILREIGDSGSRVGCVAGTVAVRIRRAVRFCGLSADPDPAGALARRRAGPGADPVHPRRTRLRRSRAGRNARGRRQTRPATPFATLSSTDHHVLAADPHRWIAVVGSVDATRTTRSRSHPRRRRGHAAARQAATSSWCRRAQVVAVRSRPSRLMRSTSTWASGTRAADRQGAPAATGTVLLACGFDEGKVVLIFVAAAATVAPLDHVSRISRDRGRHRTRLLRDAERRGDLDDAHRSRRCTATPSVVREKPTPRARGW